MTVSKPKSTLVKEPINKYLKLALILGFAALLIAAPLWWYDSDKKSQLEEITGGKEITPSELAFTLLTKNEIEEALSLKGSILPRLPEFSDQLAKEDVTKYGYEELAARQILDKQGNIIAENAITLFKSSVQAEDFILTKAKEANNAKTSRSFGNSILTLSSTSRSSADTPPSSTLRFSIGSLSSKITIFGKNSTIDFSNPDLLTSLVMKLATKQKEKIELLNSGTLPGVDTLKPTNMALRNLPRSVKDATPIGKTLVTESEWLGETYVPNKTSIPGFTSGAYTRFKLPQLPEHALDIVLIEFKSHEDALKEQSLFFTEGVSLDDKSSQKLDLPESLKTTSVARLSDSIVELQAVKGLYLYDVAIIAPFSDLNRDKARVLLLQYSQEILK